MARKKKVTVKALKDSITTQTNALAYQGKVKFQIMHGNKIISTKDCLNSGLPDLFKYISYALAGTLYSALCPCKIALFNCTTVDKYEDPATFTWAEAIQDSALTEVSPYVVYDAAPVIKSSGTQCTTTFRFKIPFNWLYAKNFNVLGLFTENNTACAYYLVTKEIEGKKTWDTQELENITGNYSLIVEWTMEVSNK